MSRSDPGRRSFLRMSGGAAFLAAGWPVLAAAGRAAAADRDAAAPLEHLAPDLAADLAAIAERILPSDETPGAREAGVIYFIDRALGTFAADGRALVEAGVSGLNAGPDGAQARFAALAPAEQDRRLGEIEQTPFFATMRFLTLAGMFAMPGYGGNRDHVGWSLLGFPHQHAWQPPFGHYDAQEAADDDPA